MNIQQFQYVLAVVDFKNFEAKMKAGADSAITQYFFNPDSYKYFVDDCQKASITQPIVPGIMPIVNFTRLKSFSSMCTVIHFPLILLNKYLRTLIDLT